MDNCFGLVLVVSGVLSHVLMKGLRPSLTCYSVYRRSWFTQIAVYSRSSPDGWFTTSLCLRRRSLWDRLAAHISYFIWHAILGLKSPLRVSDDKKRGYEGQITTLKKKIWWKCQNINESNLQCTLFIQLQENVVKRWWSNETLTT